MEKFEDVGSEYKVAYEQLRHAEKQTEEVEERLRRDLQLARKRYETARSAFLSLALGEDDEFIVSDEGA
jgi:hypothetical protein